MTGFKEAVLEHDPVAGTTVRVTLVYQLGADHDRHITFMYHLIKQLIKFPARHVENQVGNLLPSGRGTDSPVNQ
jgi:hypothetical protein